MLYVGTNLSTFEQVSDRTLLYTLHIQSRPNQLPSSKTAPDHPTPFCQLQAGVCTECCLTMNKSDLTKAFKVT